ncbi:type I restriction endonuclease subunit R [Microbulbifer bruguierae]|uniref:Type I restriction enzyme endonuclease subunit n=1 Tax=Microbulbifer bruguierae TaxID=3029061 RepID=A0ABY8NBH2_9GAMM|nr:type I restriction endonuclease subunit R [Microbulbifer bruguierae]WGL16276.1 type I restriction endonuclease subunit R [Microbulbifer bruguierae]
MISEDQLENLCQSWFEDIGYRVINNEVIAPDSDAPERDDWQQVILRPRLRDAIARLNTYLPETAREEAFHIVTNHDAPLLASANRGFHELLVKGVNLDMAGKEVTEGVFVRLLDFENPENNDWLVVRQFTVKGDRTRRPDMVVFVNGLPLAVIELKNPADEKTDIWAAYNQIETYKAQIRDLFVPNVTSVISDGQEARMGSLTANEERYLPWRSITGARDEDVGKLELEVLVRGLFCKEHWLDYLRHFAIFEEHKGKIIKKIAGYHQFFAVRAAVVKAIEAHQQHSNQGGVVWHTQGSGKSISMCCFAAKLAGRPELDNPTLVVVTDRNDLDGQLFQTFSAAKSLLTQTPVQADSRDKLRSLLSSRASGGIIFTTIQKFALLDGESTHPVLSERNNILVMSDEAHRSQYGLKAKLTESGKYQYGYAKHLRDALPNAAFVGFTGTPIETEDKDTRAVFGDYIHVYDVEQAVKDGATVPIHYESRLAKVELREDQLPQIDAVVDEITEGDEEAAGERFKSQWAALASVVGAEPRIKQVAQDLVTHFENRQAALPGKGMIVCMSRAICVDMYNAITALRPEWHHKDPDNGAIKVVMTGSASDPAGFQPHLYSKDVLKDLEGRVRDPDDSLQLVIVRDMWLTGFDAPCLHTLYIDKPMKGHNLMQAIARVNRVFGDKPGGLVVDYIGIADELKAALKTYTASHGRGRPTIDVHEALAVLLEKLEVARALLHGCDYSEFATRPLELMAPVMDFVLGQEDGKQRYCDTVLAISKAYALCGTLDEAAVLKEEVAFLQAIRAALTKRSQTERKLTDTEKQARMRQVLSNAIVSDRVVDIFEAVGLDKPNIAILSDEFMQEVAGMEHRNLAVEILERLLIGEIKSRSASNVVQAKKYSDRLKDTLVKYQNRSVQTAQVIEELIAMAKDFRAAANRGEQLRLSDDELAFYEALEANEASVRELGEEILRTIAIELTLRLRNSTTVDWQVRESVRARLRILVKRILKKYKYPPDKQEEAVDLVLKQAEVLSERWST